MRYVSTRGNAAELSFMDVITTGVATDGGLYVPKDIPVFDRDQLQAMRSLSYTDLALEIMWPFVDGDIERSVLKSLIDEAYQSFRDPNIAPLMPLGDSEHICELFHGPTLAFKDFALQFLGKLFDYVLTKKNENVVIIGATSGDTGSAALEGCRHSDHVTMFILHPKGRISDVQRRQMTTILADNVHNLAVESDFDFCQTVVKTLFNDDGCLEGKSRFVAVNSINWCRIMAQIVYYFYASFALGGPDKSVSFSVPTGNFGDIYAGYLAKKMGLPITQLIIATNTNDILHRFLQNNDYSRGELSLTLSPSMDIQVSSNFERLLYDLYDRDGNAICQLMDDFKDGALSVDEAPFAKANEIFASYRADDDQTCDMIKRVYDQHEYVMDPHTATGVCAARALYPEGYSDPMVILATAHPAKFPSAIKQAGVPVAGLPDHMNDLMSRQERVISVAADIDAVKQLISESI